MFNSQSGALSSFVEQDGCARTVIVLLLLTTVGCVSYTWGYYEGISNAQSNLMLDKLHELQLAQLALRNETAPKHHGGHGRLLVDETALLGPSHSKKTISHHADITLGGSTTVAAAPLDKAATPVAEADAVEEDPRAVAALRGSTHTPHKSVQHHKSGRLEEGGT
ncbi:hypothetical protein TSOC_002388 [Tetrabaena socialis]|uniref:Uncharacterized protein n=1 Tax=Tetrabaena socialis TaxID=47790 RepID=A0A2J8AED8_9CHLO|nr:hypothetical protein TSOC_002388 [Tetrabaena socialis]|eukprot:PNH10888.1 hypothetical protein TSOC_002388 [Tetrabaena socialis]